MGKGLSVMGRGDGSQVNGEHRFGACLGLSVGLGRLNKEAMVSADTFVSLPHSLPLESLPGINQLSSIP